MFIQKGLVRSFRESRAATLEILHGEWLTKFAVYDCTFDCPIYFISHVYSLFPKLLVNKTASSLRARINSCRSSTFGFYAQLDCLANSLHQGIQGFCLSVTAAQFRDTGHIVAFGVAFYDNAKCPCHLSSLHSVVLRVASP